MLEVFGLFVVVFILSVGLDWALLSRHIATYIATHREDAFPNPPSYFSYRVILIAISSIMVAVFINHDSRSASNDIENILIWPAIIILIIAHIIGILRIRSSYK